MDILEDYISICFGITIWSCPICIDGLSSRLILKRGSLMTMYLLASTHRYFAHSLLSVADHFECINTGACILNHDALFCKVFCIYS